MTEKQIEQLISKNENNEVGGLIHFGLDEFVKYLEEAERKGKIAVFDDTDPDSIDEITVKYL